MVATWGIWEMQPRIPTIDSMALNSIGTRAAATGSFPDIGATTRSAPDHRYFLE